uniref:Uncharacterized protein n=1 Tax=Ananas comosus var. bracteatus TaxID=296719 RepID=A0A6V7NST6_ANACO|nr:unnamed protein product [Ananas comosus var. bracteatus]
MEPKWTSDAELYYQYHEETRLVQLLMALQDDFEYVRAFILYHDACVLATSVARNTRSSGTSRDMRYQNSAPRDVRPTSSSSRDISQEMIKQALGIGTQSSASTLSGT